MSLSFLFHKPNSFINPYIVMMEFLETYHLSGIAIGLATFLIIGLFHPVVIKAEYYWGVKCWWLFLVMGIAGIVASLLITHIIGSVLCGVFAFSALWSIGEIFEQRQRVAKGWFPANPARKEEYRKLRTRSGEENKVK